MESEGGLGWWGWGLGRGISAWGGGLVAWRNVWEAGGAGTLSPWGWLGLRGLEPWGDETDVCSFVRSFICLIVRSVDGWTEILPFVPFGSTAQKEE